MSVLKVVELVGTSSEGWEKAVQAALDEAGRTIKNIESVEVINLSVTVEDGKIAEWVADTRVSFQIEEKLREGHHRHHEQAEMSHI